MRNLCFVQHGMFQSNAYASTSPTPIKGVWLQWVWSVFQWPATPLTRILDQPLQPEFSLPVVGYTVTVTRHTEISQALCLSFQNEQSTTTSPTRTATTFIGLQEFSSYTVRVTANFSPAFGLPGALMATGSETFTTLSSGEH